MRLKKTARATLRQSRLMLQELDEIASLYMVQGLSYKKNDKQIIDPSHSFRMLQKSLLNDFVECGTNDDEEYLNNTYGIIFIRLQEARAEYLAHFKEVHNTNQQEYLAQKFSDYFQRIRDLNTDDAKNLINGLRNGCKAHIALKKLTDDLPLIKMRSYALQKNLNQKIASYAKTFSAGYTAYLRLQLRRAKSAIDIHEQKIARTAGALVLPCLIMYRFLNQYAMYNMQVVARMMPQPI